MNTAMTLWLVGLAVAAGVGYAGSCWLWPFRLCGRCGGDGKMHRDDGRVFRNCRRCKGSGRRLRYGRRWYNHLHHQRARAVE